MTTAPLGARKLDQLDREELLVTTRRLLAEAQALSSRIAALNEISVAINRTFDLNEILHVVSRQSKWLLDFEHFSACLRLGDDLWQLNTLFGKPVVVNSAELIQTKNVGKVLLTGQSQLILQSESGMLLNEFASQIIVPLTTQGEVTGTLNFATTLPKAYTQDDLRIGYMLALQLASAIRNADHVQKLNRAHAELRIYNNELQASNRELDAYNYTIAHDLKTPLTSIGLNVDLVQRTMKNDLPPKVGMYLENIKGSSYKMADMIDQLLWLARSRNSNETLTLVEVKPRVEAAIHRFQHALDEHHITATIDGDIPMAMGHGQWIEEVFANLISNAIKYMGTKTAKPSITIRASSDENFIRYEVIDTGIGIEPEDQKRLFEMFTRLNTVKADGIGLGLSIVARMVGGMGGMAGVDSVPDQGSTFWFMLPHAK